MFTAGTNSGNFMFVVILKNGVCALRLISPQRYLKNVNEGQLEHVYHSTHVPLLSTTT